MADLEYHVPETQMISWERIRKYFSAFAEGFGIALLAGFLVYLLILFVALLK